MDGKKLLEVFHKELRAEAVTPGYIREDTGEVVRHVSQHKERGFILDSRITMQNAAAVIQKQIDFFQERGEPFEWKVYSYDKPDNLVELLEAHGFITEEEEALMVIDHTNKDLSSGCQIAVKELVTQEEIQSLIALEEEIWGTSHQELGRRLWRDKQEHPDSLFLYGVWEGGALVSGAWMYLEQNSSFASLWGGSTLPEFRKKGYYTALLAARAQKAAEQGYPYLMVDASPMSRPILERNGFQCLAYSYECQSPE